MTPSHVLVPLDGSPLADEALSHALETYDCRTTVLNVVTPLDASMSEGAVVDPGESRRAAAEERAATLVEAARRRAEESGRNVETVVETGDPADTILSFAAEHDVDHVVMGGHGGSRSGLAARLLGTVATTVVSEAPMTVTVVRE
ncbi:universal stress protein [Haloarchaeobius sp. HRN-SO-5]|uniref:universal stress protein n=1 Tax=Haloarchaeobius sp. HRN-SO-5 TaxID=3446118 RepID=UPI003EC0DA68